MRKSVHCLTNKLFMAMDDEDIVLDDDNVALVALLTGRV
jgi:hypothetical protein